MGLWDSWGGGGWSRVSKQAQPWGEYMLPRSTVLTRLQLEGTLAPGKLQYKGVLAIEEKRSLPVLLQLGTKMGLFLSL